jgi:N6-L-threonylcarbamoyladenine synthase
MSIILAIESSCDDTSAAIIKDGVVCSNIVYTQKIHEEFGGVVPELASRNHEKNIVVTVEKAIVAAGVSIQDIEAVAFTRGPGLIGSLLVGVCFAKSFALAHNLPLIEVNHMQAHVLSPFIENRDIEFPLICMVVSGGHTQLVYMKDYLDMEIIGSTIDDAAGEAFDKAAKMLGLDYPGGPLVDKWAKEGNPLAFTFAKPRMDAFNYSFSGIKTSILYFLQKQKQQNPNFIQENLADLCASIQHAIVEILIDKLKLSIKEYNVKSVSLAGGVSANSELRKRFVETVTSMQAKAYVPAFQYCTDNAGMIAVAAYFKYKKGLFSTQSVEPLVKNYAI